MQLPDPTTVYVQEGASRSSSRQPGPGPGPGRSSAKRDPGKELADPALAAVGERAALVEVRRMGRRVWFALWMVVSTTGCTIDSDDDRVLFAKSATVAANERVADVVCIFGSIRAEGAIEGDAVAVLGNVTARGNVDGDVVAAGGDLELGPGVTVGGDAVAVGGYLTSGPGAAVVGERVETPWYLHVPGQPAFHWRGVAAMVGFNVLIALSGGAAFRRRRSAALAGSALRHPVAVVLLGGAIAVLSAVGYGLLDAGRLQVMVDVAVVAAYLAALVTGYTVLTLLVGSAGRPDAPLLRSLAAGAVVLSAVYLVPIAGFAAALVPLVVGFGASVTSGFGSGPDWLQDRLASRRARGR